MEFWKLAWDYKAIDESTLRMAVKCDINHFGDITPEEFKEICGEDFIIPV